MSLELPYLGELPALPSFLTATGRTANAIESKPVYRSIPSMTRTEEKNAAPTGATLGGLGGLSVLGLTQSVSLPSFLSPTGHFALGRKLPVFRDLKLPSEDVIPTNSFRSLDLEPVVKPRALPPVCEKNTSFSCSRSASEIFRALGTALAPYAPVAKPEKGKYKGVAQVMGQFVAFQVHIFQKPAGGEHLVEFQRRRGDSVAFWHLFRNTMETLSSDLADAAAFLKSLPNPGLAKKWAALVGKPTTCSPATIKAFEAMASSSVEGQLEAIQAIDGLVGGQPIQQEPSTLKRMTKITLTACTSKDEEVASYAKGVLANMLGNGVPLSAGMFKGTEKGLRDHMISAMASSAIKSMKQKRALMPTSKIGVGSRESAGMLNLSTTDKELGASKT